MSDFSPQQLLDDLDDQDALDLLQQTLIGSRSLGFDYSNDDEALGHFKNEVPEIVEAFKSGDPKQLEHEAGDLYLILTELLRRRGLTPERPIQLTVGKFLRRLQYVIAKLEERGKSLRGSTWDAEVGELWNEHKKIEKQHD